MPRTPANITQADVARAIRAAKASGEKVTGIHFRKDGGVVVEFSKDDSSTTLAPDTKRRPVL